MLYLSGEASAPHHAPVGYAVSKEADSNGHVGSGFTESASLVICSFMSVILWKRMETSQTLTVRILGLGDEGSMTLPSVAGAVANMWSRQAVLEIESIRPVNDERLAARSIRRWCDRDQVDVVFTVGCSGHGHADFAPGMTAGLLDRTLPGIEERMYLASGRSRLGLLFRGKAGMRKGTLVVNLPAHPARIREIVRFLGPVVVHATEKARGSDRPCVRAGGLP